jgi:serine protease
MTEADAQLLAADPRVAFVVEDQNVHVSATQVNATWGLDRIDQASLPLNRIYNSPGGGAGVTAYIIDTGINKAHNEFAGRIGEGFTVFDDGRLSSDCNGHGTHVAGTVGGTNWGVAKDVTLVPVKVLDCTGTGSNAGVIAGIDWVIKNHSGASVINMSTGSPQDPALNSAVRNAVAAGITVVVAAGNNNSDACNYSPSSTTEAITVGNSDINDTRAVDSNSGTCVDIWAPGSSITSAALDSNFGSRVDSGTSMAAPHVAGAAALYLAAHPSATPAEVASALIGAATVDKITDAKGSPNKLLNISFMNEGEGGGGDGGTPPPATGGTAQTGSLDGSVNKDIYLYLNPLNVLAGTEISVTMTGTGDADLYIQFGAQPTNTSFACASETETANEVCNVTVPAGQTQAHIGVLGFTDATFHLEGSWVSP